MDALYPFINVVARKMSKGLDPTLMRELGGMNLPQIKYSHYISPKFDDYIARGMRTLLYATNPLRETTPSGAWDFCPASKSSAKFFKQLLDQVEWVHKDDHANQAVDNIIDT